MIYDSCLNSFLASHHHFLLLQFLLPLYLDNFLRLYWFLLLLHVFDYWFILLFLLFYDLRFWLLLLKGFLLRLCCSYTLALDCWCFEMDCLFMLHQEAFSLFAEKTFLSKWLSSDLINFVKLLFGSIHQLFLSFSWCMKILKTVLNFACLQFLLCGHLTKLIDWWFDVNGVGRTALWTRFAFL